MQISDKALLIGCLKGDSDCQEKFVRQYSNLVFATIQRAVKAKAAPVSMQSMEDLHQTVFLSLFENNCRKLRQYKGENGCSVASWIRMLTSRIVLDHLRRGMDALAPRHQTVPMDVLNEIHASEPSAFEQVTLAEQWDQIEIALDRLKARDQLVLRMHFQDGRSLKTIAHALGISEKTIHSVKHRAIQRLKRAIETKN